jgi:hypothetical protein
MPYLFSVVLSEIYQTYLAELWQESWIHNVSSKVFALPFPLAFADILQATKQHSACSLLPIFCQPTNSRCGQLVSCCRNSVAHVLGLIQDSCHVEAVKPQIGPNNTLVVLTSYQNVFT